MDIIRKDYVGNFRLDNKVDVTDPCYDKDTWCRKTLDCEPGDYYGYAEFFDEGEWGKRVARLSIYKDDWYIPLEEMEMISDNIGVDAGLCGFFRDKPDFDDQDEWIKFLNDSGIRNGMTSCIDYGIFSDSGYGDGCYEVYANKERTAFTLVFIDDYEDEEEEYDDEDAED